MFKELPGQHESLHSHGTVSHLGHSVEQMLDVGIFDTCIDDAIATERATNIIVDLVDARRHVRRLRRIIDDFKFCFKIF